MEPWILSEAPDHPEEACGVFGVYAPGEQVGRLIYFGLHALQHRGQESAGIAVADGHTMTLRKELGLVPQVFKESDLATLDGHIGIGHTPPPVRRHRGRTPSRCCPASGRTRSRWRTTVTS
jgi:glutamine phosphoribosylpyrophosphate amidotransferase